MLSTLSCASVKMDSIEGKVDVVAVLISAFIRFSTFVGTPICLGASVAV